MRNLGKIGRIGLVSSRLLPMIIVAVTLGTVKTRIVVHVEHAETTSICGLMDPVKHIAIGGADFQTQVGIVEGCNQMRAGQHIGVNPPSSLYAKQVKYYCLYVIKLSSKT